MRKIKNVERILELMSGKDFLLEDVYRIIDLNEDNFLDSKCKCDWVRK